MTEAVTKQQRRRVRFARLTAFAGGMLVAAVFLRRQLRSLALRAVPYVRRSADVDRPVLISNPWSGDGKATQVGLADAARSAGIATVVMEAGDDLEQLASEAVDGGADAIGMAGGDGSLGVVAAVAVERGVAHLGGGS